MGARGPLPIPDNVRKIRGDVSHSTPVPSVKALAAIPNQPSYISKEAKAEWKRITPELKRLGVLATIDRAMLTTYCETWALWNVAREVISREGVTVIGQKGETVKHPAWQIYRDAATLMASLAKELGVSPNARLRMKAPDVEHEDEGDLD